MLPGSVTEINFAYVFARTPSGDNFASVSLMQEYIDSIRQNFGNPNLSCGCDGLTSVPPISAIESSLSIYPNPTSENINLSIKDFSKKCSYTIYDMRGAEIKNGNITNTERTTISISDLSNGIYLISVSDGNNLVSKRFTKQ